MIENLRVMPSPSRTVAPLSSECRQSWNAALTTAAEAFLLLKSSDPVVNQTLEKVSDVIRAFAVTAPSPNPASQTVRFTVPLTPPSVNHYKKPAILIRGGQRVRTMVLTEEALAYKAAVGVFARGETVAPAGKRERDNTHYALTATVYMGKGERGDGDNHWKLIGDGLVDAGVIHSDAAVSEWHLYVRRDRENPRTVIEVQTV
jgi:Holliday junction resolvase RusA-like endonuclease